MSCWQGMRDQVRRVNFGIQSCGFADIWLGILGDKVIDSSWPASQIDSPEPPVRPLTRDEAKVLLARRPSFSLWQMLLVQCATGLVLSGLWGFFAGRVACLSSLYGAAVAVVPNILMARALAGGFGKSVAGLVVWELVKVLVAGCLLVLAPFVVPLLVWPALLLTAVLCMKVVIVASLWRGRTQKLNAVV